MPALLIRDLPDNVHERLKRRASQNHRSLTKEAVAILEAALSQRRRRPTLAQVDRRRVDGNKRLTDRVLRDAKRTGRP